MSMYSQEWKQIPSNLLPTITKYLREPDVKLGALAKELGLMVKSATLAPGISGEIGPSDESPSGFQIRINRHEAKARQRFTLAHEIAHFLLHKDRIGDGIRDDMLFRSALSNRIEAEANRLAADLIMPLAVVEAEKRKLAIDDDGAWVEALAEIFGVSLAAMQIRLGIET